MRFLIVAAALICGYFALTVGRTAGADSTKISARPRSDLRGPVAIRHLEKTRLSDSLSAAVTTARYQIAALKEAAMPNNLITVTFGHLSTEQRRLYR
jgi:hypothetical protein